MESLQSFSLDNDDGRLISTNEEDDDEGNDEIPEKDQADWASAVASSRSTDSEANLGRLRRLTGE